MKENRAQGTSLQLSSSKAISGVDDRLGNVYAILLSIAHRSFVLSVVMSMTMMIIAACSCLLWQVLYVCNCRSGMAVQDINSD
jgi:hypothetical protein